MASVLLHPGPHTLGYLEKISSENELISLHPLCATLNIKLNPCSTSQGHGSETPTICKPVTWPSGSCIVSSLGPS